MVKLASLIAAGMVLATVIVGGASLTLQQRAPVDRPWRKAIEEGRVIPLAGPPPQAAEPKAAIVIPVAPVTDLVVPAPPPGAAPATPPEIPPEKPD